LIFEESSGSSEPSFFNSTALCSPIELPRRLDGFVEAGALKHTGMAGRGRPWFATHAQIADLAGAPPIETF
jgi:hypothetical protein